MGKLNIYQRDEFGAVSAKKCSASSQPVGTREVVECWKKAN